MAADIADLPLACALKMGADQAINLANEPEGLAPFAVNKGCFDLMFEASGSEKALINGLEVVAPRGVIVTIGLGGNITLPLNTLVGKEIDLRGTFRFHAEFAVAVAFLNQRLIDGQPVITNIVDVSQAGDAFRLAGDKRQSMKVQIAFDKELA